MQVIHWGRARKFFKKNPAAKKSLMQWRKTVQEIKWTNFPDVKNTFNTADWVSGKIIFDIKGNDYRLVAVVDFGIGKLYIRQVMTHEDYDKNTWK